MSGNILVTGAHRSGTSWTGKMLSFSKEVAYIWEPCNIYHRSGICNVRFDVWYPYINQTNASIYYKPFADMLTFSYDVWAELQNVSTLKDLLRMGRDVFRFQQYRFERRRPLLKDPMALFSAEWLASTFDMQVVVLIRHPAAFAGSLKRAGWHFPFEHFQRQPELVNDKLSDFRAQIALFAKKTRPIVEQAALLWNIIYSVVLDYQAKHPDWFFVRHEDLSRSPVEEFRVLYKYLNLNFTSDVEQKIFDYTASHNPTERVKIRSVRRDSKANIFNWKHRLTDDEIQYIRSATRDIASHFYDNADW